MKRLPILILSIAAIAAASAHEPATLRHGYRQSENLALRGKVKQVVDYFACDTLESGAIVPDTTDRLYVIFDFNRAGNVVREEVHDRSCNVVQYVYNEQDKCTEERRDNGEILCAVYDTGGRQIESYKVDRDGNKVNHWAHKYDKRGHKIATHPVNPTSDYIYERYEYDSAGNCVRESSYHNNGKLFETKKMHYDRQGRMVKFRKRAGGSENRVSRLRRNKTLFFDYTPHVRVEYRYDERGNCIEELSYFPLSEITTRRTRQFNAMNNCIDEQFFQMRGDSLLRQSHTKTQYEYDAQGNWIRKVRYLVRNGESHLAHTVLREITYYE